MPLRDELLSMDPQCLSLLVLAGILLTLIGKVYFISVVWSCYKFLTLQADGNENLFYRFLYHLLINLQFYLAVLECENCITDADGTVDGQNLLEISSLAGSPGSDLPDYATAMTDPRFAKKPIYPNPPPPYAAVVHLPQEAIEREPQESARAANANVRDQEDQKP